MTPPGTIRFRCSCGRTVVTQAGSSADSERLCTRCRLRAHRLHSRLVRPAPGQAWPGHAAA